MKTAMSPLTEAMGAALDPLGPAEERRAIDAALGRVESDHVRVYGAELRVEKRRGERIRRQIAVLVATMSPYAVHEVIVDEDGEVVDDTELLDFEPPFTDAEIGDAISIARADDRLRSLAERKSVRTAVSYAPIEHASSDRRSRLAIVRFFEQTDSGDLKPIVSVTVDLSRRTVRSMKDDAEPTTTHDKSQTRG